MVQSLGLVLSRSMCICSKTIEAGIDVTCRRVGKAGGKGRSFEVHQSCGLTLPIRIQLGFVMYACPVRSGYALLGGCVSFTILRTVASTVSRRCRLQMPVLTMRQPVESGPAMLQQGTSSKPLQTIILVRSQDAYA
jgi:hypothetical protein